MIYGWQDRRFCVKCFVFSWILMIIPYKSENCRKNINFISFPFSRNKADHIKYFVRKMVCALESD